MTSEQSLCRKKDKAGMPLRRDLRNPSLLT